MVKQQEISDVAKETICILNYFNPDFTSKIPKNVKIELKQLAKESNIIINIDKNKSLKEQNVLPETRDLIAWMYYSYIATEEEQEEMVQIWNTNEKEYQEKIKKMYNPDDLFKKKIIKEDMQNAMVEYKQTILQKIFYKLKKILHII